MHTGTVLWYDHGRGYGFVADHRDNQKIFITHRALEAFGVRELNSGSRISFKVVCGRASKKVSAITSLTSMHMLH